MLLVFRWCFAWLVVGGGSTVWRRIFASVFSSILVLPVLIYNVNGWSWILFGGWLLRRKARASSRTNLKTSYESMQYKCGGNIYTYIIQKQVTRVWGYCWVNIRDSAIQMWCHICICIYVCLSTVQVCVAALKIYWYSIRVQIKVTNWVRCIVLVFGAWCWCVKGWVYFSLVLCLVGCWGGSKVWRRIFASVFSWILA